MKIVTKKIASLKPYAKNAKKHDKRQVEMIAESIKEFGFTQPVLIDENNVVVAGHGRILGAKKAGLTEVPTVCLSELTKEQIKAYRLSDNKLNESGWNQNLVDLELKELFDFDMSKFGFPDMFSDDAEEESESVSFKAKKKHIVEIECKNEKILEQTYKKLVNEGYICKIKR